jgi:hypothetical protein
MVVFELDNSAGLNVEEGFGRTLLRVALDTGVGGDSAVQILVTYSVLVVVLVHQEQCMSPSDSVQNRRGNPQFLLQP